MAVMHKNSTVEIRSILMIFLALLSCKLIFATETMECYWHCAYFDVKFVGNYGGDDRGEKYTQDVIRRANVVIQLDNLLRIQMREGKLERFTRWILVDDYMKCYDYRNGRKTPKQIRIEEKNVFFCLTDSNSINDALGKLWNISDLAISPSKQSGLWLFSLHVGFSTTSRGARPFHHGGYIHERPDSALLWLKCDGSVIPHHWYQHETDGYYHQYTGLYLTRKNVVEAQELLRKHCDLNANIVSHYVTFAIIRRYAGWDF